MSNDIVIPDYEAPPPMEPNSAPPPSQFDVPSGLTFGEVGVKASTLTILGKRVSQQTLIAVVAM